MRQRSTSTRLGPGKQQLPFSSPAPSTLVVAVVALLLDCAPRALAAHAAAPPRSALGQPPTEGRQVAPIRKAESADAGAGVGAVGDASSGGDADGAPADPPKGPGAPLPLPLPLPHLMMVLQDDMGYFDPGFQGNWANLNVTGNISSMAHEGIILKAHYSHYWCSPTRRSFLTGRLPVHHGEMLSSAHNDDVDLRWNIISQKLAPAGYESYWYGKGHTGFKSMAHLPTQRGFKAYTGFLEGSQGYRSSKRWQNEAPLRNDTYSTELFGEAAVRTLRAHNASAPLFMYLPWQAVHAPYDPVPGWEVGPGRSLYQGMLYVADQYLGQIRSLLRSKGMWENTLLVYSSDNGGRGSGNNWPLRGKKATNYEGGMRVAAFVSGGRVPLHLRGTSNNIRFHICDWYATFAKLAGQNPADDPPLPPLPIDPAKPKKDIYGNFSFPGVDGVDIWDLLMHPENRSVSAAHPTLVLSKEAIIVGSFKLLTAQRGDTSQNMDPLENKWQHEDGSWFSPPGWKQTCGEVAVPFSKTSFRPCLFDLANDMNETTDLGPAMPKVLDALWGQLNRTWLTAYHSRSPKRFLGTCDQECATRKWKRLGGEGTTIGPICGVKGCGKVPMPHWWNRPETAAEEAASVEGAVGGGDALLAGEIRGLSVARAVT